MKVLAIDTSTMMSSICVLDGGVVLGEYSLNQEQTHSELLLPMTDALLKGLGLKLSDIDLYAVAKGPGSFTGLRIGMSAVKTMAQVLDKKIVGVSTLEGLAYGVISEKLIMPLIDARGKRFFAGIYKWEGGKLINKHEDSLYNFKDIKNFLENSEDEFVLVGEGTNLVKEDLDGLNNLSFAHSGLNNCISSSIGLIGLEKAQENELDNYFDLAPNYIRKSQAEIDYGKRNS